MKVGYALTVSSITCCCSLNPLWSGNAIAANRPFTPFIYSKLFPRTSKWQRISVRRWSERSVCDGQPASSCNMPLQQQHLTKSSPDFFCQGRQPLSWISGRPVATGSIPGQCPPQCLLYSQIVLLKRIIKTKILPPRNVFSPPNLKTWMRA